MKSKTTLNNERLTRYAASVAAVSGISAANAQIIYTDVSPDITINAIADSLATLPLDIDGDGVIDMEWGTVDYNYVSGATSYTVYGAFVSMNGTNGFIGSSTVIGTSTFTLPSALNSFASIGPTQNWGSSYGFMRLNWAYNGSTSSFDHDFGNWNNVVGRFLGVRFDISGTTHYGWVRFDVGLDGSSITLRDYAYRAEADTPIQANQMPTSVEEISSSDALITGNVNQVKVQLVNSNEAQFELLDLSGKVVYSKTLNQTEVVEVDQATGIYIARVVLDDKTITKKVYLY